MELTLLPLVDVRACGEMQTLVGRLGLVVALGPIGDLDHGRDR